MKHLLLTLLTLTASILTVAGAKPSAATVLQKAADAISSAPSLTIRFTIAQQGSKTAGTLTLSGDKFKIDLADGNKIWYDGTTQWTFNHKANEMDISSPTPDELATINPFVIVTSLRKTFKSRHLNSPAGKYVLELNAINRDNDIRKATITIDSQCKQPPSQAKLTLAGGATVTIDVQSAVKGNSKLAVTAFRPDKKSYPKTEWIDLR